VQESNINLQPSVVEPYLTKQLPAMRRMEELGVPLILSEFNSVSCGGSNISDTVCLDDPFQFNFSHCLRSLQCPCGLPT